MTATGFQTIRLERAGPVARVVLNRPEIRNAFNDVMIGELRGAFAQLAADPAVRVVVLTGEGVAFCAGADLHWMRRMLAYTYAENYEDSLALAHLMREMYEFPRPLVCRVNGPAIGGGTGLVAVCDIVVASDQAVFSFSEVRIGLVPACISPYVLRRVGERSGREYFLTGERLSAEKALAAGLVNQVAPAAGLDAAVAAYTETLVAGGPEALAACKRMIREVGGLNLDAAGPYTAEIIARLRISAEGQEGMSAFLERRPPAWCAPPAAEAPPAGPARGAGKQT